MRMKIVITICVALFVLTLADSILWTTIDVLGASHTPAIEEEKYKQNNPEPSPSMHSMIATAYCLNGTTATGTHTRHGIAASKREWFGKTAKVYWNDGGQPGSLMGEYVIEDTGGRAIRNGSVIDIWMPTEAECFDFGRRVVFVEIID